MSSSSRERAILFIDGNNWYHSLCDVGVPDRGNLDYEKISNKLVVDRQWAGTRYYIGRVPQNYSQRLYAGQRSFLAAISRDHPRITTHLGRLEPRPADNALADELLRYLDNPAATIDPRVHSDLVRLASRHKKTQVWVEKAVDVELAVDMVTMAERGDFDVAYLLSADGDYTPAVKVVRAAGRRVFVASPNPGHRLRQAADVYIRLTVNWFDDCYRDI